MLTRREFVTMLPAAGAALAVGVNLGISEVKTEKFSVLPHPPAAPAPVIEYWEQEINSTIESLEAILHYLAAAPLTPPDQVDGQRLLDLEMEAILSMEDLQNSFSDTGPLSFERCYEITTGRTAWFWSLREDILQGRSSRDFIQKEIDVLRRHHPDQAEAIAELQALLDGGAL